MHLEYTAEQQQLREQIRAQLESVMTPERSAAVSSREEGAGSDLAALQTTAVRHGDEYVINGQKMFTSGAGNADYPALAP